MFEKLIREPLVHFLLLGAALFVLYGLPNRDPDVQQHKIVVSAGQIEHLEQLFARVWQRPPTAQELKGLIDGYVEEEMLSREAMNLGLDRNDTVIRRRLRQKMEFLAEDFAASVEPSEEQLADYLAAHPDKFAEEARISFRHVYLNPDKRGERIEADAEALLGELKGRARDADVGGLGDRLMLPAEMTDAPGRAVASQFGEEFAAVLDELPADEWAGPVRSGYGLHLVLVTDRTEGHLPALANVRDAVRREWLNARRLESNRALLDELMSKYQVTVEWPETKVSLAVDKG